MFPGWGSVQAGYQGSSPYGPQGKPTFFGAVNQLASPFSKDPYWGNPADNNSTAFQSMGSKPFDSAAWIGQRIAMPAAVFGVSSAMFRGAGASLGQGIGQGMFGSGMIGRGVGGALGWAGSFGLPFAIGSAAAHAVDSAVFQPYIRTRQQSEDLVRNFSGVTFGGSAGNPMSGRGLSGTSASSIASSIDRLGIRDMTFNATQMHSIAGMGMRAGLFDDVGAGQITSRFKDIAAQVKLLVSISKDPNIQSAIEQLAQLRAGGASIAGGVHSDAARAFSRMGMQASMAGVSVQQLMAASQQGQYMYQANGMTPYLGALAAGNAYAGFSSAFRTGGISSAFMARMGGVQGATNSALGGQLAANSSAYNMLGLYNQNFGGAGANGSVVGTAARFGSLASQNPVQVAGDMLLYGGAMLSKQSRDEGSGGVESRAIQMLRAAGQRPSGSHGRWSPSQLAMGFQAMGMSPDQIRAFAAQRATQTDPKNLASNLASIRAQGTEQMMQYATQEGLYNGPVGKMITGARRFGKGVMTSIADNLAYPVTSAVGGAIDAVEEGYQSIVYGSTIPTDRIDRSGGKRINVTDSGTQYRDRNGKVIGGRSSISHELYSKLNTEAGRPGALGDLANEILNGQVDSKRVRQFAQQAGMDGVVEAMESNPDLYNQLVKDIQDKSVTYASGTAAGKAAAFQLVGKDGALSTSDSLAVAGQARALIVDADKNGLSLGTDLDSYLKNPKYTGLKKQLDRYTPAQRAAVVKYDATTASRYGYNDKSGRLDGQKFNMDFNESQGSIAGMLNRSMATNEAAQAALDDAKSPTDWGSMTKNMDKFDGAVKIFSDAVNKITGGDAKSGPKSGQDPSKLSDWMNALHLKTQTAGG